MTAVTTQGTLAHFAINAHDIERGRAFYEKVFGWRFQAWGPPRFYQIDCGDRSVRGAIQQRRDLSPAAPTVGFECTMAVASIDATEAAVLEAGGSVALPRSVIEGVGTLMFFRDTEGNVFGAMEYASRA